MWRMEADFLPCWHGPLALRLCAARPLENYLRRRLSIAARLLYRWRSRPALVFAGCRNTRLR